ncbi:DUF7511 domain-containing protein [Halorussus lipolyticus]|uniref:DUF7511 domain-containing protein n=1 Tax=Halorussus lipolyticus TaxID=3034024 RepID=UPI0023E83F63|nr:hypothetical protein [Halorussus sp. DT80]
MSTDPDTLDTPTETDFDFETEPRADRPSIELDSVVVEYDERPDRRTIYPGEASGTERMSSWLTADDAGFVDLDAMR